MNHTASGGYVGLLVLLITFLLVALFLWRIDLFFGGSGQKDLPPIEQDLSAIKAAENAKRMIESTYNQQPRDSGY
ncbi:hypothetical protein A3A36_02380 [Candidatus Kaiserbacteria bacterium RIFCSPLOWO2_01_FULL_52_12b]|uniref:Uncharacterized protein n=1 Tax=Candidatus Kaiserbacteria bacterium RIFCSPLOWO2_01_FULL_52_12b TaxID=1798509 RepID=A0A1F6EWA4_9BACT|nr:MAG: hypothetical protein A3A36_02380 [Candidatus Kaiserbacteria bacterium RIFCSPLOWO2_01_FULL_52_12b]